MKDFATLTLQQLTDMAKLFMEGCSTADVVDIYNVSYADADDYRQRLLALPLKTMGISRSLRDKFKDAAKQRSVRTDELAEKIILIVLEDRLVPAILNETIPSSARVIDLPPYIRVLATKEAENRGMSPQLLIAQILHKVADNPLLDKILDDVEELHQGTQLT